MMTGTANPHKQKIKKEKEEENRREFIKKKIKESLKK